MKASRQTIWFFSEGTSYTHKHKRLTRDWMHRVIRGEGYVAGEINIVFCPDAHLSEINLKYLKHNTLTDIVTFDMSDNEGVISGDIYISVDRAKENSLTFGVEFREEVRRLIVHGLLHLAGYKDKLPEDKATMRKKEDYYLSLPAN